jgi:hypothetical protein
VFGADAEIYEGMRFHVHCLPSYLSKQEAGYEKKRRLGKITLAENIEYLDIRDTNQKVRNAENEPTLEKTFFPEIPKFVRHNRLAEESIRHKMIRSTEEWKRLGISRHEYAKLCAEREEKRREKYQIDKNSNKKLVAPGVAGEISSCLVCGKRTFVNEGKCQECSDKNEQKLLTISGEL